MCTVTFLPGKESIYFTSSRNEGTLGNPASLPAVYEFGSGKVIYPKDGETGGTWIAGHENGNVVIFLNGAHQPHSSRAPYRKSQGLILLDLIDHITPLNCFLAVNLNNIEPFTAIIRDNRYLFTCRWDGTRKEYEETDVDTPDIWTSVTGYKEENREKRKAWFRDFLDKNPYPSHEDVLQFHRNANNGDIHYEQVRGNEENASAGEGSITSIDMTNNVLKMIHIDLSNNQHFSEQLRFDSSTAGK